MTWDQIKDASKHGDVVVLLNSDAWLIQKKGREFLPYGERKIIMSALKNLQKKIKINFKNKKIL